MNGMLNYIIEANIGLVIVLAFYKAFLQRETNFSLMRTFLLTGISASVIFPLVDITFGQEASILSVGQMIPSYWLPEVVIGAGAIPDESTNVLNFWKYAAVIYLSGLFILGLLVFFQIQQLIRIISRSKTYRMEKLRIAESAEDKPTFSFFHFIFIGKADQLSSAEKQQIIRHEGVHAKQWHSFDILLINLLKICFWFNPFINAYKRNFIQLHEFEADARAVENLDVNKYCSLLARVALKSADFTLANHFNNSLTVKRIEMMRTIKTNIKRWKLVALATMVPLVFFFVSCQDQVMDDLTQITQNSSHALIVPAAIQVRYEQLKKENPDKDYALLELNETATQKLQDLESKYGLPKHIEVFNTSQGETSNPGVKDMEFLSKTVTSGYSEITLNKKESKMRGQTFAIVEFTDETNRVAEASQQDKIYTVVQHQPEFPGGYDAMIAFIKANMRYPTEARQQGIEGTTYVSFVVGKDGTISDVILIRGISASCDAEAKRVVEAFPNWIPGKHNGQAVAVRFVLPVKFNLNVGKTEK
jgi:TonB family protein